MKPTLAAMDLMLQGSLALADMESAGIAVDVPYLGSAITSMERRIAKLEAKLKADPVWAAWQREFGARANLGSRAQLGPVLEKMGHASDEKTATGRRRTNKDALAKIDHPFVRRYLRVEKLKKLSATFLHGLKKEVDDKGFVHPFFHLASGGYQDDERGGADSYRSSSTNPNLQNQWNRDPEMAEILRKAYIPRHPDWCFSEIDYGSHEFCIAAAVWGDPEMIQYANDEGRNVHRDMACKIYKCKPEQVTKQARDSAKNQFTFPILYGSYHKKIAQGIWNYMEQNKVCIGEMPAKEWLATQGVKELGQCNPKFDALPGTFEWHVKKVEEWFKQKFHVWASRSDQAFRDYQAKGRFRIATGFVLGGLCSKNFRLNAEVQGPAFHCLLWATTRIRREFRRQRLKALQVAEVHDCTIVDHPVEETQQVLETCRKVMIVDIRKAMPWTATVNLKCEVDVTPPGKSWWDKAPWIRGANGIWKPK